MTEYQMGYEEGYQKGYNAAYKNTDSIQKKLDEIVERYDSLHKQFGNALVEASQCKRLYERYKDLLEFYLERTEFTPAEQVYHQKLFDAYDEIENLERALEITQDVVVKLTQR